ncbi:PROM2 protein, partial [Nothoprocta ornata]|nr:PROM2 protein [Nothoprocta ornata]
AGAGAGAMRAAGCRAPAAALLLPWVLVGAQQCPPGAPGAVLRFSDTHADIRVPALHRVPGVLDPLYRLVRRCLDLVQPNPLPTELLRAALNDPASVRTSQVLHYELGYVAGAAGALLLAVALPTTGICLCYWRRRRRCRGGRLPPPRRSPTCHRHCLLAGLSVTSLLSLATVICAFLTNQRATEQMGPGLGAVPATLRTLRQHLGAIPQGVHMVVEQFQVAQQQILTDLAHMSRSVGVSIHSQLKATTYAVLAELRDRAEELRASLWHLQTAEHTVRGLAAARARMEPELRERRERTAALLDDPRCTSCASALGQARSLQPGADYGQVPSLERMLQALAGLPRSDLEGRIGQANSTFNAIPELAVERMAPLVQELRAEMAKAAVKVQDVAAGFPAADYTNPLSEALRVAEEQSQPFLQATARWEGYRWVVGTVLCSVVLLIGLCHATGVVLGTHGLRRRHDPADYECCAETGARLLVLGAALAFLASTLLSLLVSVTFLLGGNVQTLLCRSWASHELYKFLDTPGNLPPSLNLSRQLNLRGGYNFSTVYHECRGGAGLWEVLQLDTSYDLDQQLQVSKFAGTFQKRLDNFSTRLGDVRLLHPEVRRDLETFTHSGVDRVDYGRFQEEMRMPLVRSSLGDLAARLQGLQRVQRNGTVAARLAAEARALWRMHNHTVQEQEALVTKLGESIRFLVALAPQLQARVNGTLAAAAAVEAVLPAQAQRLLRQELACFARRELRHFSQYLHWLGQTLREDVASCQPLATALDNGRVILCDRIADPWNAAWFSLGCCTLCLVPGIVLALCLAKHFRPLRNRLM